MKMRNLLLGVFLGLFAVIHSSTIESMTHIPARPEEDVLDEVMTDGFLVDHSFGTSFTTEPPKINTTVQASQMPSAESLPEGSGFSENYAASKTESPETSTAIQASLKPSSDNEGSAFLWTPTETPEMTTAIPAYLQQTFDVSSEGIVSTDDNIVSHETVTPDLSTTVETSVYICNTDDGSAGSGDSFFLGLSPTTSAPTSTKGPEQSTTTQATRQGRNILEVLMHKKEINDVAEGTGVATKQVQPQGPEREMHKGHVTPDWIIIVGFLVGLAALITLCAAIATRDKWNGPNQATVNKTNATNQKREQEMQIFLSKEQPKENGKDAEYTVVPLDDLADHYSSY